MAILRKLLVCTVLAGLPCAAAADDFLSWEEGYAWNLARQTDTVDSYRWFLDRYPDSRFSPQAFRLMVGRLAEDTRAGMDRAAGPGQSGETLSLAKPDPAAAAVEGQPLPEVAPPPQPR